MKGAGTSRRSRDGSMRFGCETLTPFARVSRCLSTASTRSTRVTRPRPMRANGCSSPTKPSRSAGGRRAGPTRAASNLRPKSSLYGKALGETANLGVISAVFFKERVSAIARESAKETERRPAPAAHRGRRPVERALPTPIVSEGWTSRSTPRPGWAAAPITRLPKCGWISRKHPRRR